MSRICSVSLPLMDYAVFSSTHEKIMPSIGLAYLATLASSLGHEIWLRDAEYRKLSLEEVADSIAEWRPDIVAVSIPSPLLAPGKDLFQRLSIRRLDATFIADRTRPHARAHDKVLRIARTIADLDGAETIESHHLAEAVCARGILATAFWNRIREAA